MAGKIVGQAIVKGNAEAGVTIAEIIGMVNRYGLSLGCEKADISKVYKKSSSVALSAGTGDPQSEYGGDSLSIEAWSVPSYLTIHVDAVVHVIRDPGNTTSDPGGVGCYIVFSDEYPGDGPIIPPRDITAAFADGTTGQNNINATVPISYHAFVSCQHIHEILAGEALKVWGVAHAYTAFYTLLDPLVAQVDISILRVAR